MAVQLTELAAVAPAIRRGRRLPAALVVGGALVLILIVVAGSAQWIAPYPYDQMHVRDRFLPPSLHYLAGTDEYGRDVLSRLLFGSQLSLALGVTATLISMGIGVPLGLIAGYRRGVTDELVMRTLDVMLAFPPIMLVLLILACSGNSPARTKYCMLGFGLPTVSFGQLSLEIAVATALTACTLGFFATFLARIQLVRGEWTFLPRASWIHAICGSIAGGWSPV